MELPKIEIDSEQRWTSEALLASEAVQYQLFIPSCTPLEVEKINDMGLNSGKVSGFSAIFHRQIITFTFTSRSS